MQSTPVTQRIYGELRVEIHPDDAALGAAAARDAAAAIRLAVSEGGEARVILATGNSQLAFLSALAATPDVPWRQVDLFHMDEYVGLDGDHPASFRRFLRERIVERVLGRRADARHQPDDPHAAGRHAGAGRGA
jgi:glucosamine-6-phosphate deaminase